MFLISVNVWFDITSGLEEFNNRPDLVPITKTLLINARIAVIQTVLGKRKEEGRRTFKTSWRSEKEDEKCMIAW